MPLLFLKKAYTGGLDQMFVFLSSLVGGGLAVPDPISPGISLLLDVHSIGSPGMGFVQSIRYAIDKM